MFEQSKSFGLIVIGDEILAGRRRDRHFEGIGERVRAHGHHMAWLRILPDDPDYLIAQLEQSMSEAIPVFSCGGIGATPDDHTRRCAAIAANAPLNLHPEAVSILHDKFGDEVYPTRIRMAELPEGSELIPNPVNRVPGFYLREHYFLPGFPDMAHPMVEWVLENHYPRLSPEQQRSVWVTGATETALMPLMEALTERFPAHKLFSLPRLGKAVELGYRGDESIAEPYAALLHDLEEGGFEFEEQLD